MNIRKDELNMLGDKVELTNPLEGGADADE